MGGREIVFFVVCLKRLKDVKVFHVSATFVQSINYQTLFYDMGVCDTVNVLEVLLATSTSSG